MTTMLDTIVPKSDQLNADDLIGRSITIKVTQVSLLGGEQPVSIHFEGDGGKPYKPGKSMRRVLVQIWGADANNYIGRSMSLYRDDAVKFGGLDVGGIRISHMSHLTKPVTMALTATRASRKPFTVQPLAVAADKAKDGSDALVARIKAAGSIASLQAIAADATVVKQREYLTKNRSDLAESVAEAIAEALAAFDASDEPEPGSSG